MPVYKVYFTAIVNADSESEATSIGRRSNLVHQKTMLLSGVEQEISQEGLPITKALELSPEIWMEGIIFANESQQVIENINFEQIKLLYWDRRTGECIFQANLKEKPEGKIALIYVPATKKDSRAEVIETVPQLINFAVQKFLQISSVNK